MVNDPLNLASYVNDAVAVGSTTVNAFINFGIAEFNYFFGWLIPPLPPLPLAATEPTALTALKLAAEPTAELLEPADGTTDDTTVLAKQPATATDVIAADAPTAVEPADPTEPAEAEEQTEPVQAEPADPATLPTPTQTQTAADPHPRRVPPTTWSRSTEPVVSKPETDPEKATGTTTTTTPPRVTVERCRSPGRVRGGTDGSQDAKPAEGKKPDATKDKGGRQTGKDGHERLRLPASQARRPQVASRRPARARTSARTGSGQVRTPRRRRVRPPTAGGATARTPVAPRRRR